MDGVLNLERLWVSVIHVPVIHALASMLASPVAGSATVLTHLDLHSCGFGLEGVTSLLLALGHNTTLTHLNVGLNRFDIGFGHVLADFLLTNSSVTHLHANHVCLKQADVSSRLLTALESNFTITSLLLAQNQLCSGGASAILNALIKRAQVKSFKFVDLSGNDIALDGLKMIAEIFESVTNTNGVTQADSIRSANVTSGRDEVYGASRKCKRDGSSDKDQHLSYSTCDDILIDELRLQYNDFKIYGSTTLIKSIRRWVGRLKISKWDT